MRSSSSSHTYIHADTQSITCCCCKQKPEGCRIDLSPVTPPLTLIIAVQLFFFFLSAGCFFYYYYTRAPFSLRLLLSLPLSPKLRQREFWWWRWCGSLFSEILTRRAQWYLRISHPKTWLTASKKFVVATREIFICTTTGRRCIRVCMRLGSTPNTTALNLPYSRGQTCRDRKKQNLKKRYQVFI